MPRRAAGPSAWLIDDVADAAGWAGSLRAAAIAGVVEIVPAESTVLVVCDRARSAAIGPLLDTIVPAPLDRAMVSTVTIDVVYDGADLADVAAATGLTDADVIERHASGVYTVAFCGFSPGFGYLRGLDTALHLPRRDVPRTRVPAGSVAIAAGYSCVYPSASPGGWHLLGTTSAVLWDESADEPALLSPGTQVRFRPVSEAGT
jgi:KipI family sensor histidine kinase inhibitor